MRSLEKDVAAVLRRKAEALVTSRGISLQEARETVWAEYLTEQTTALAAGPDPPAGSAAEVAQPRREPTWNDTGSKPKRWNKPTDEQKQNAKQHVQQLLGVITKGKHHGTKTY